MPRRLAPACVLASLMAVACDRAAPPPPPAPATSGPPPTFSRDIAPILFTNCAPCHRPGQVAPFTLLSYADVQPRLEKIARATRERHMPPWLPEPNDPPFLDERRLTGAQIELIQRWAAAGGPEGAPADLPSAPVFSDDWQLGRPDRVLTLTRPYRLTAGTHDVFRNVIVRTAEAAPRRVRAIEFRSNGAPVHHAIIRVDPRHVSRSEDGRDGQPGFEGMTPEDVQNPEGHFVGWTPGRGPILAPEGLPWTLEAGADLVVELHLLPGKQDVAVQPAIGVYFTDAAPARSPLMVIMGSKAIDIPAGQADYAIEDRYTLPVDVELLSIYPHAHFLGHRMDVEAVLPDGRLRSLLHIRHWSFHWQQAYRYASPVTLPKGTLMTMRFTYDNSASNEHNPHAPPQAVTWGPRSVDEMGNLGLQVLTRSDADARVLAAAFDERNLRANVASAEMLVRHEPGRADRHLELGKSYAQAGRLSEAQAALEQALRLDARLVQAHNFLGGVLVSLNRPAEALPHFRDAVRLAPEDAHLQFNLARGLDLAGQPAAALSALTRALTLDPRLAEAHQYLGARLFAEGRLAQALTHLQRAAELRPDSASIHSDLGGALAEAGRTDEARRHLRRALELDPGSSTAAENLARLDRKKTP